MRAYFGGALELRGAQSAVRVPLWRIDEERAVRRRTVRCTVRRAVRRWNGLRITMCVQWRQHAQDSWHDINLSPEPQHSQIQRSRGC